jgi:hypothetical protein
VAVEAMELETLRQVFLDNADRCLTVLDESLVARYPTDSAMLGAVSVSIELPASTRACGVGFPSKPSTVAELVSSVQQALTEGEGR